MFRNAFSVLGLGLALFAAAQAQAADERAAFQERLQNREPKCRTFLGIGPRPHIEEEAERQPRVPQRIVEELYFILDIFI